MITFSSESGQLLKSVPWKAGKKVGFTRLYGVVSEGALFDRQRNRRRHGFHDEQENFQFSCVLAGNSEEDFSLLAADGCEVQPIDRKWIVRAPQLTLVVSKTDTEPLRLPVEIETKKREWAPWLIMALLAFVVPIALFLFPPAQMQNEPVIIDQVQVHLKAETQQAVHVSSVLDQMPEVKRQTDQTKRAINQKLGFLGLLGKKDLKKAMGGVPTDLKDVSPGAGAGGNAGSGGEVLVGLGQGLRRTTVGNTGTAGLGGVGTKGAGGGAGGYGNSAIGSGEGRTLSSAALSQDLVLEGGLDRSVVQATIAKYLSQVRACYENGLKRNPGLRGQVHMAFEISGLGDVNYANVKKSSLEDAEVESCISQRMLGWKFPSPRGGVLVKVSYPFVLRSSQTN